MVPQEDKKVMNSSQEKMKFLDTSIQKQIEMLKNENLNLKRQVRELKLENDKLQKSNNQS